MRNLNLIIMATLLIAPLGRSQHLVTSSADSGIGSLRAAIAASATGDTIAFSGPMTISLSTSLVLSTDGVTISGVYPDVILEPGSVTAALVLDGVSSCKITGLSLRGFNQGLILINGASQNQVGDVSLQKRVEVSDGMNGALVVGVGTRGNHFVNVELHEHSSTGLIVAGGASENRFGDGTLAGAVHIHSNDGAGVLINGTGANTDSNLFELCLIGTDAAGLSLGSNGGAGVSIEGTARKNRLVGCVISGNLGTGVTLDGGAEDNSLEKCHIGVDIAGTGALGNANGVHVLAGFGNHIGPANVISGNPGHGVIFEGNATFSNEVFECTIGPYATGGFLGNGESGVHFLDGTFQNTAKKNHISCNRWGVLMEGHGPHENQVVDNLIGTDASGTSALPNLFEGVLLRVGAYRNDLVDNVVSGNWERGIKLEGSNENRIVGNAIGVDRTLVNAIPNLLGGVLVQGSHNQIGGPTLNEGNAICANGGWGIQVNTVASGVFSSENMIENNQIGLTGLGNASGGVFFGCGAVDNVLGGLSSGTVSLGNSIRSNGGEGVLVDDLAGIGPADGNKILTNSITDNALRGIELNGGGNCRIPPPLITSATTSGVGGHLRVASVPALVQVFQDLDLEGEVFLGETWVSVPYGAWSVPVSLSAGMEVTATETASVGCTTSSNETSPFSSPMVVGLSGTASCFCTVSRAPCGNSYPSAGCANSTGVGASLRAYGPTSVGSDDIQFSATNLPTNVLSILLGSRRGRIAPAMDGISCLRPRVWRMQVRYSRDWGASVFGPNLVARSSSSLLIGDAIESGEVWYFQAFYRDPFGPCATGANFSNRVRIAFTP